MTSITIYGNNQRQIELQTGENNLLIFSSGDSRKLPGTVIVLGNWRQNHTLSVFFRNHKSITVGTDGDNRVRFYEEYGKYEIALLELDLRGIGGIGGVRDLPCGKWNHRLMYDFEKNFLKGGNCNGTLTALAKPFRGKVKNGMNVPQELIPKLFKR